jgi:hypothetical protein
MMAAASSATYYFRSLFYIIFLGLCLFRTTQKTINTETLFFIGFSAAHGANQNINALEGNKVLTRTDAARDTSSLFG